MHDAIIAERLGVPAVGIMTEKFSNAASLMARVLGYEDYPFAVIGHPISSATEQELAKEAQKISNLSAEILAS